MCKKNTNVTIVTTMEAEFAKYTRSPQTVGALTLCPKCGKKPDEFSDDGGSTHGCSKCNVEWKNPNYDPSMWDEDE